jgi:hypothetical protein
MNKTTTLHSWKTATVNPTLNYMSNTNTVFEYFCELEPVLARKLANSTLCKAGAMPVAAFQLAILTNPTASTFAEAVQGALASDASHRMVTAKTRRLGLLARMVRKLRALQ